MKPVAVIVRWNKRRQDLYLIDPGFAGRAAKRVRQAITGSAGIHEVIDVPPGMVFAEVFRIAADGSVAKDATPA